MHPWVVTNTLVNDALRKTGNIVTPKKEKKSYESEYMWYGLGISMGIHGYG